MRLSARGARVLAGFWYLSYYAGISAIQPYYNVYFQWRGLSDAEIGILSAARQWVSVPAGFLWSAAADRLGAHRGALLVALAASAAARLALMWGSTFPVLLGTALVDQFFASPVTVLADAMMMSAAAKDGEYGRIRAWGALGWGAFAVPAGAIIDRWGYMAGFLASVLLTLPCGPATAAFRFKGREQGAGERGGEAAEGAAAGAAAAAAALDAIAVATAAAGGGAPATPRAGGGGGGRGGPPAGGARAGGGGGGALGGGPKGLRAASEALSFYSEGAAASDADEADDQDDARAPASARAASCAAVAVDLSRGACGTAAAAAAEADARLAAAALPLRARLGALLSSLDVWLFLWQALLQGYGLGLCQSFLFITLARMEGSAKLMGLTITVDCLAEFPAFWFKEQVLRVLPVDVLLHAAVAGYALRLALYSQLPLWGSPWLVLPVQLLHGLTYAWGWGAGTVKGGRLAPPGLQATMQGLFQGAYVGVGAGLGALAGGWLSQLYGIQKMWGAAALTLLAGWVLLGAASAAAAAARACAARRRARRLQWRGAEGGCCGCCGGV
ncbi:hypothetical protein Rsub_03659 [Raphidocelis subcapitata]|uniref:Major facilitator superfamily associated domain-containing protein n=1 Tax=Raphidocelis subcapitata TaxID=307507 RepID=A0A2V0NVH7_9CHLO|nr:hypothetical protein Rsub_03659 [Raphidocelis subcapitata]|eukprot:GBF91339.1 hypothetical protein Rsub_03659 [Raphidocelis subcapitata]